MTKKQRAAALQRLKAARSGEHIGRSALDDLDDENDDDDRLYDELDEDEYRKLVESRREREDFVVDDDGLGYYDDGEEHMGEEEEDTAASKKRTTVAANATLTAAALKKARKNALAAAKLAASSDNNNKTSGTGGNTMWNYVNKGTTTGPEPESEGTKDPFTNKNKKKNLGKGRNKPANSKNVDDLLQQLDAEAPLRKRPRMTVQQQQRGRGKKRGFGGGSSRSSSAPRSYGGGGNRPTTSRASSSYARRHQQDDEEEDDDGGFIAYDNDDDDDNCNAPIQQEDSKPAAKLGTPSPASSTKSVRFADNVKEFSSPDAKKNGAPTDSPNKACDDDDETKESAAAAAPRRRVLARPKLGQLSKPAQKAIEQTKRSADAATNSSTSTDSSSKFRVDTSVTFKPDMIAAEVGSTGISTSTTGAGQLDLAPHLKTDSDNVHYIDMFWMDIAERNGDILLFGKIPVEHNKFVSACAVVGGNVRNLFVLPKPGAELIQVHQEINALLHDKGMVPLKSGASWAGKVVKRNYAFADASIPREETDYLKVVYDAKYPVPSEEVCQEGGEHFVKIMGAGASTIENFIIKRKLMGPCWVRIRKPTSCKAPLSWCKLEFAVDCPKQIVRLDLEEKGAARAPPPVVTLSLKFKTVVHPKTHKSEIVSVSAVCHKNVMLETASDQSPKYMTQLSLIRPLSVDGTGGSVAKFPRDIDKEIAANMPQLKRETNERAMLSRLLAQIGQWDPDVIVGHNAWGFDIELLLARCGELKVQSWSKIGRRHISGSPQKTMSSSRKDLAIAQAVSGRLLCDTYLSAKEHLRETTYTLTNLAATQLKTPRQDIEPVDVPHWFHDSKTIVQLALHTLFDAQLVQRLMFKLQILPLSKQLTCIAGNLWSHTLKSNRAERTEYLLLHEFHRLKFLAPEKKRSGFGKSAEKSKAKYSGGLVLEPKKGLYDSYILLLDFNSLYPSLIQEYNLCFTTINWAQHQAAMAEQHQDEAEGDEDVSKIDNLAPLPDDTVERGVLPRVIKSLVERRRAVKTLLKNEKNPEKKEELDIRQNALKLTANSMYGCLGFSNSRFFAQPIAALVTAMGRETLQRTVDIAQNTVGLDVIYGDTDSIMINTRLNQEQDLKQVRELGDRVKKEVNRLYKTLELEIDGIFRSMLLLKKKKYAAKTVLELPNGEVKYGQELKGLDLVRRDWCVQSKDTGRYVTEQILSGQDSEVVVQNILAHLEELAKKMRAGELPVEKYVITKGLSKHPNEYPDGKSQPHVQVAKMMLANNRPVNTGDHIPYVITAPLQEQGDQQAKAPSATERARHPEEIARSDGALKPDIEWYLMQQILPPISRLCEPIEGLNQQIIAERLGLDASRYNHSTRSSAELNDDDLIDYTPASLLKDEERFKDVEKLRLFCFSCGVEGDFPGVFHTIKDEVSGTPSLVSGLRCTNPDCLRPMFWGQANQFECHARIANSMSIWVRGLTTRYYEGLTRCDEPSCGLETRQQSVAGGVCLRRGCNGRMVSAETERSIHTHLKYLETLFDVEHSSDQLVGKNVFGRKTDIMKSMSKHDRAAFDELHRISKSHLELNAFNWISPSLWKGLLHVHREKQ